MKCFGTTATEADFGDIVWARVPGSRLLLGKYEVNWLEPVWLRKTENTEEHLCGDEHGVRKFWTIRRQPESTRWRRMLTSSREMARGQARTSMLTRHPETGRRNQRPHKSAGT